MDKNLIFIPAYNGFDTEWPEAIESLKQNQYYTTFKNTLLWKNRYMK